MRRREVKVETPFSFLSSSLVFSVSSLHRPPGCFVCLHRTLSMLKLLLVRSPHTRGLFLCKIRIHFTCHFMLDWFLCSLQMNSTLSEFCTSNKMARCCSWHSYQDSSGEHVCIPCSLVLLDQSNPPTTTSATPLQEFWQMILASA